MISFKNKKFTLLHLIFFSLLITALTFYSTSFWKESQFAKQSVSAANSYSCPYQIKRMDGYKFIKPLMFVDDECESDQLVDLKLKLTSIINRYKANGDVNNASIYVREYTNSTWTTVNDDIKYDPGSLFKVPVLITILRMNELTPGFLNKSITYSNKIDAGKSVAFADKSIKLGNTYTVKELLTYMIKYSDNNATILLERNMDSKILQKLFADVGLDVPNIYANQYQFSPKGYSYFMRAIYNSAYLSTDDSEYAAELLSQCQFKDGILKGLPSNTRVAHKFGESGNQIEKQLHESALVYLNDKTYLLTIMTRGKENEKLSQLISEISQSVYNEMSNKATASL